MTAPGTPQISKAPLTDTTTTRCPEAQRSGDRPKLTIFFQLDPLNPTIGGIQTCIKYVLKYASAEFRIQLVGIRHGRAQPATPEKPAKHLCWQTVTLHGREFEFLPLLDIADDNVRGLVPTTIKYALALRKYLKTHPLDSDFYQFHRIEPTVFTWRLAGTKLLYIHNDIYQEVKGKSRGGILWKRMPWAYFALERQLVKQFDRILSCNSKSAELYQAQYPDIAEKVSYLPNTFDGELFYPLSDNQRGQARRDLAKRLKKPDNTRFILFAGRLHPQKQPVLLVQAMAHLVQRLNPPESHLIVVGKGELAAEVRQEIDRHQLGDRITLLAPMPQADLAQLYQCCDLFVLTSAYEGLARGSLEALACGTPVVTTRAGETPNFLTSESGIVCEDATPAAIAACWQTVLQNPHAFPSSACANTSAPYAAKQVVEGLYGELLTRWRQQPNPAKQS